MIKLTFFLLILMIFKTVNLEKVITVEQVDAASKEETSIKLIADGKTVLDVLVHQSLPPAPKNIFKRQKTAASNNLKIEKRGYNPCFRVSLDYPGPKSVCINYMDYEWYGGSDRYEANWSVQNHVIIEEPYVLNFRKNSLIFGEPYWLNSNGQSIYVTSESALFIDSNNYKKNHLCFIVKNNKTPYVNQPDTLEYELCQFNNTVLAHKHAIETYLNQPKVTPAENLYRYPTYVTSNGRDFSSQQSVRNLANQILKRNFKIGALSISSGWETCYWSFDSGTTRFPNIKNLTDDLHGLGVKVMVELHPYFYKSCYFFNDAKSGGRLVRSYFGDVLSWGWAAGGSAAVDLANVTTQQWFVEEIKTLIKSSGIDFIDYGGGVAEHLPELPLLNNNASLIPNVYATKYLEAISAVGIPATVSVGKSSQYTSTILKMRGMDKSSNGLKASLIQLLNANLHGYVFTKSDLIGGSGFGNDNKELYIRWLQASIFTPSLQFYKLPWEFDEETAVIAKKFLDLRERKFNAIKGAIDAAIAKGTPVNAPIWWIAPNDETAFKVSDQYLLGEYMIVAPVLDLNQRSRFVYLPKGNWFDCTTTPNTRVEGPRWLYYPSVPLDQLPYFVNSYAPYPFYYC